MTDETVDELSAIFAALADPTRRAILIQLTQGDANVQELSLPYQMSQPAVSKHLKVLEKAGLISRTRVATANFSHLEAAKLKEATDWLERYREYWQQRHDKLEDLLQALKSAPTDQEPS